MSKHHKKKEALDHAKNLEAVYLEQDHPKSEGLYWSLFTSLILFVLVVIWTTAE